MVVAFIGFSKFPIFYNESSGKVLGYKSGISTFDTYVYSLPRSVEAVAIYSLNVTSTKRRFVINYHSYNPYLKWCEKTPKYIYVFPEKTPCKIFDNV